MNITELDKYNLNDAIKFHDRLNPRLWDEREHLRQDVHDKLMQIARDFQEFLGVEDLQVKDITISGSNAAYTYTPHSDIDLHLVADLPDADNNEVYRELFDAKKFQYNSQHDIRIGGYDVELYVQNPNQEHHSQGIYSLMQNKWLSVPKRRRPEVDDISVKSKYEDIGHRIEAAIDSGDRELMSDVWNKLKTMRKQGLEREGEFSPENLAFKMLRNNGTIEKFKQAQQAVKDRELSLAEQDRPRQRIRYGFGEGMQSQPYSTSDGVAASTKQFLEGKTDDVVMDFIRDTAKRLGIRRMPRVHLHNDAEWSEREKSFGMFIPNTWELHVNTANRHLFDILRTTAHELAHCRQHELGDPGPDAGETGSDIENEAHAVAGIIMRDFADSHPDWFTDQPVLESSGYIPTEREKNDPRFKMALTVDIKPGQTGREANKMALKTDAQGKPALLMKTANLRESKMPQPSQGPGKYRDLNQPLGPETPPTMPKGTVKVDVSDVYDWYKLGSHISNLKGLGKHDFGAGPPSTIISFGDEDTEHQYIKDLEKTGLTTTDIDPASHEKLPGQKTDPTYNVDEEDILESLRREFALLEDEYISEVRMSTSNLRQLAAQTGAMAGMEFEMIVPDVEGQEMDPEYERDESYDRRARSFDDIEEFFYDGDYNGRGDIRRLMDSLREDFENWKMERLGDDWSDEGVDFLRDYIANNDLFDREDALDTARDEIIDANPDLPPESEDFQQLVSARINEMEEAYVMEVWEDGIQGNSRIYDNAFEEFVQEKGADMEESDFLQENTPYMSDVESSYDVSWPYFYDINDGQGGEISVDEVADDFSEAIGRPVNASRSYHGGRREAGTYVVEPDGSLEGDNPGDGGLEFVSPPLPIDEMLSDLNKVKEWAGKYGCYTNDSTGLHINISVPNYSLEKLDYVKLALLMGDEYVLDLFGRSGNHYAKAATGKIKTALKQKPELAPALLDKMRGHMEDLATKAIHSGQTDKYTSINTKTGYIEFRSPGGDWLDANFDKIENTLLRFTVALSAAIDPQAYRKEYLKKLYKLLEGVQDKGGVDIVQLFANYSAGELDKAALIRQVRQSQLGRKVAKGIEPGKKYWWNVEWNNGRRMEVVAGSERAAKEVAAEEWGVHPDSEAALSFKATVLRPYEEPAAQPNTGNWGIWLGSNQRFSRIPGTYPAGQEAPLRRFPSREAAESWLANHRAQNIGVRNDIEIREIEPTYPEQTGNWGIWAHVPQRFAALSTSPGAPLRRFETQAAAQAWLDSTSLNQERFDVAEIPADYQRPTPQGQAQQTEYELYRRADGRAVTAPAGNPIVFRATTPQDAESKIPRYVADFNLPGTAADYDVRSMLQPAQQSQEPSNTQSNLTPRGPGPWEIYRLSDNSSVRELSNTDRTAAGEEARRALGLRGEAPELYGVRTRQQQMQPGDIVAPGLGEVPAQQPQQQTFTGYWDVMMGDQVVFRVQAETQGEANNKAREWVSRTSPEFRQDHQGQEMSVVPRYA
jgi:hypothetical protein